MWSEICPMNMMHDVLYRCHTRTTMQFSVTWPAYCRWNDSVTLNQENDHLRASDIHRNTLRVQSWRAINDNTPQVTHTHVTLRGFFENRARPLSGFMHLLPIIKTLPFFSYILSLRV